MGYIVLHTRSFILIRTSTSAGSRGVCPSDVLHSEYRLDCFIDDRRLSSNCGWFRTWFMVLDNKIQQSSEDGHSEESQHVVKEGLLNMYHTVSPTVCGDANIRVVNVKVSYNYKYSEYN